MSVSDTIQCSATPGWGGRERSAPQVVEAALADANLSVADVDWLLLHQANQVSLPGPPASTLPAVAMHAFGY